MEEKDSAVLSETVSEPEVNSNNVESNTVEEVKPFSGENTTQIEEENKVEEPAIETVSEEKPTEVSAPVAEPTVSSSPAPAPVTESQSAGLNYVDKLIDRKILNMQTGENVFGVGRVTNVKDFIIEVVGISGAAFYEKINIANKAIGYITKLETNHAIVAVVSQTEKICVGDVVYQTNEEFMGEFSNESLGKVIDMFGYDKLANKKFSNTTMIPIEELPTPIMDRTDVKRPLETGIAGIDLIYPIGKGQRQLIIGDKKTGKTQILLDTICNQKDRNVICMYVAIGKTKKEVKEIYYELLKRDAAQYTIIVTAFYDDLPPVIYLTPYFAMSVANQFMKQGFDVLVTIDDLSRHALAYREISLISGKSPGRDAYPSDIFYAHSRLLERGCQYKSGASITILPVIETRGADITDYISTNVISITDGQIVLSSKNFQKGIKPAINYGLSVSRLGGAVQDPSMKAMGAVVRYKLLSYLETREVYELANVDEMSKELQEKLFEGKKILDALNQYKFSPMTKEQIIEKFSFIGEKNGQ
jgi:F-type H+-transporting ATPase subunit alpha